MECVDIAFYQKTSERITDALFLWFSIYNVIILIDNSLFKEEMLGEGSNNTPQLCNYFRIMQLFTRKMGRGGGGARSGGAKTSPSGQLFQNHTVIHQKLSLDP